MQPFTRTFTAVVAAAAVALVTIEQQASVRHVLVSLPLFSAQMSSDNTSNVAKVIQSRTHTQETWLRVLTEKGYERG